MKHLLLAALLLSPAAAVATPSHCDTEAILNISSSGEVIQLTSGQVFRVYPGQDTVAVTWEPQDKITICALGGAAYEMTQNSGSHAKVDALRQF